MSMREAASRIKRYLLAVCACASLAAPAVAQNSTGIPLNVVEEWIAHGVSPARIWKQDIEKDGIAFQMDFATEQRLRAHGATDEWVIMLRRARINLPATPIQQASSPDERREQPHSLTKAQLLPIYFGHLGRVETYATIGHLTETGGTARAERIQTNRGSIAVNTVPIAELPITYGIVVGGQSVAFDFEGYFHQPNFMMINAGLALDTFLPIGTTGIRVILGATPFIGDTRQIIGHTEPAPGDTTDNSVQLHNAVIGADARSGLAYHWRPGGWLYAELHYRGVTTVRRDLVIPGGETFSDGIPWSGWAAHGVQLRLGIGW